MSSVKSGLITRSCTRESDAAVWRRLAYAKLVEEEEEWEVGRGEKAGTREKMRLLIEGQGVQGRDGGDEVEGVGRVEGNGVTTSAFGAGLNRLRDEFEEGLFVVTSGDATTAAAADGTPGFRLATFALKVLAWDYSGEIEIENIEMGIARVEGVENMVGGDGGCVEDLLVVSQ